MGILDEMNNMKSQGMDEREIVERLQEKGVTPKAIEDAFNQMRIKKAVSAESTRDDEMAPSIMTNDQKNEMAQNTSLYIPKTQEINKNSEELYSPNPPKFNENLETSKYGEYNQEEYVPQEGYEQQESGSYNTDTIIEIAEQIFAEKIKTEQKQIASLNEFATLAETRLGNDHDRIKKMEDIIDHLQAAILEKVSSYGRNLDLIKNGMGMMQESFAKMIPELHEKNSNIKKNNYKEDSEEFQKETQSSPKLRKKMPNINKEK
jgi:hypothetical protein